MLAPWQLSAHIATVVKASRHQLHKFTISLRKWCGGEKQGDAYITYMSRRLVAPRYLQRLSVDLISKRFVVLQHIFYTIQRRFGFHQLHEMLMLQIQNILLA